MRTHTVQLFRDSEHAETVPAGEFLYRRGQPGETMYLVLGGEVDLLVDGEIIERVGPGAALGDLELLEGRPRVTDAVVASDARILPLDRRRFLLYLQTRPHFAELMVHDLADRLREQIERNTGRAQRAC